MKTIQKIQFFNLPGRTVFGKQLIRKYPLQVIFPFYHSVSEKYRPHLHQLYHVKNTSRFIKDLDFLLRYFSPVSIEQVVENQLPNKNPCFHLSFDDGLKECSEVIAPVLQKKGIPASFFVNPAFIDNTDMSYRLKNAVLCHIIASGNYKTSSLPEAFSGVPRKRLFRKILELGYSEETTRQQIARALQFDFKTYKQSHSPYMNDSDIRQLIKSGFHVGAHSLHHHDFSLLTPEAQIDEAIKSINYVHRHYPQKFRSFAFPFSDAGVNKEQIDTILEQCDISFGTSGLKTQNMHPLHYQRIPMESTKSYSARKILPAEFFYFYIKKCLNLDT